MRPPCLRPLLLVWISLATMWGGAAQGGRGAAELSLDRTSVAGLLAAALPDSVELDLPGVGVSEVRVGPPGPLVFRDGGIETVVPVEWVEPGLRVSFEVRFVPEVDPLYGRVRLKCESAEPTLARPLPFDLAELFEPLALPQRLDWKLDLGRDVELWADCFVQGVEIRDDRLVLLLGLELTAPDRRIDVVRPVSARDR